MTDYNLDLVGRLGGALYADKRAITALFSVMVACNKELALRIGSRCKKQGSGEWETSYSVSVLDLLRYITDSPSLNYELDDQKQISGFSLDNQHPV
jgi:hypothetical protein